MIAITAGSINSLATSSARVGVSGGAALTRASITIDRVDLWHARLALKTLRKDRRQAIAAAVEEA